MTEPAPTIGTVPSHSAGGEACRGAGRERALDGTITTRSGKESPAVVCPVCRWRMSAQSTR